MRRRRSGRDGGNWSLNPKVQFVYGGDDGDDDDDDVKMYL
jgi:hypothetical protein